MVLVIDNYDSFTYNLVQYLSELGAEVQVRRNDVIDVAGVKELDPDQLVISPGPCTPSEAGISVQLIRRLGPTLPMLGVCLGHQAIGAAYGARITQAPRLMHGKTSAIHHFGGDLYHGVDTPFVATRYHSLIVAREDLPEVLAVTAEDDDGVIMGIRHRQYCVEGVQFHPESILTECGKTILANFLQRSKEPRGVLHEGVH